MFLRSPIQLLLPDVYAYLNFGDGNGCDGHLISGGVKYAVDGPPIPLQGNVPGRGALVELLQAGQELGTTQT